MDSSIQITYLTGTSPFDVYVCDYYGNNCEFIYTLSGSVSFPVNLILPDNFVNVPIIKIKVVDGTGCETSNNEVCN